MEIVIVGLVLMFLTFCATVYLDVPPPELIKSDVDSKIQELEVRIKTLEDKNKW